MRSANIIVAGAFVLLATVLSVPAVADLVSASSAYAKGDFLLRLRTPQRVIHVVRCSC